MAWRMPMSDDMRDGILDDEDASLSPGVAILLAPLGLRAHTVLLT